ncbi:Protein kinase domain [Sesbania bispinosa]|nr:Protein kinase domain [Sesbania bispinosa]
MFKTKDHTPIQTTNNSFIMVMGFTQFKFRGLPVLLILFYLSIHVWLCTSLDTISSSHFLNYSETLSSSNGFFHLGFFTPQNSTFSYLGIWYMSNPPVVWVANRDKPLNDSSGTVKISEDGNLVLMNGKKEILWSTNVSNIASNTTALLLDTGNLVLQESATRKMNENNLMESPQDPSIGNFSLSLEHLEIPEVFTWRGSQLYWRSGPWNGQIFLGTPDMSNNYLDGFYLGGKGEGGSEAQANNRDGFLKLQNTKVPDFVQWSSSLYDDCRTQCLQNCSCLAYAYDAGIGCMLWSADLIDIQRFSAGGTDLYIRVPYSELDEKKKNSTVIIAVTVTIGTIIILTCGFVLWKRNTKSEKINLKIQSHRSQVNDPSKFKLPELSQFEFEKLATATNNFHVNNKLGQGGFGPVYKGTLEDGQEIAVKRLSRTSGQGLEEFMNEVLELARDRPTMTTVISMLSNETVYLPTPRRPAFIQRQTMLDVECSPKMMYCAQSIMSV